MLIPRDVSRRKYKKGDIVVLMEDLDMGYYVLTKGHELIYWGKDNYGVIVKEPETEKIIKKVHPKITHKVTIEDAKRISINVKERRKFIKFIADNCPQKSYTIEDRDRVDTCKWKEKQKENNYGWKYCKPSCDCIGFIPEKKYENNSFILNYNRKLKLKKIKQLNNGNIKTN